MNCSLLETIIFFPESTPSERSALSNQKCKQEGLQYKIDTLTNLIEHSHEVTAGNTYSFHQILWPEKDFITLNFIFQLIKMSLIVRLTQHYQKLKGSWPNQERLKSDLMRLTIFIKKSKVV